MRITIVTAGIAAILIAVVLLFGVDRTAAARQSVIYPSNEQPYPCPYTTGVHYQAGVFPRYDIDQSALVLVNTDDQLVGVLDTFSDNVRIINWSPDCRYLAGAVGSIYGMSAQDSETRNNQPFVGWSRREITIWDVVEGRRVVTIPHGRTPYLFAFRDTVQWRPDAQFALILGGCPRVRISCVYERSAIDYIWNRETNQVYRVAPVDPVSSTSESRASFNQLHWDIGRGWLIGSGPGAVTAYDVYSGAEVRSFPASVPEAFYQPETQYVLSADGQWLIAYSLYQAYVDGSIAYGRSDGIVIHNLNSGESIWVNAEGFAAPNQPLSEYRPVALSPDNRYLIAGYTAIRIWDLHQLSEDMLPNYRHAGPNALIDALRFSEAEIIETISTEGIQYWDLHTGSMIR